MSKKILGMILILAFLVCTSKPSYCDDCMKKLGRGIANVLTFPMEVPEQAKIVNESDGPLAGLTWGVIKGVYKAGVRALVGVYEIISFPVPVPKDYRPILEHPEFFFSDM